VNYTILIIDDDEATHDVLGAYLSLSGYQVLHAYNGVEGLELLRKHAPDLALLDVQMPEVDGFRMLEQVRRDRQLEEIPILILSSLNRSNLKVKGLEAGADDYIIKPFDRAEILARIKVALRRSRRFSRNNSAMSGDLAAITIAELLQTMELGKRSCTIDLPDLPARITMVAGAVTRIEQGTFSGAAAMQRIMLLERGRFAVTMDNLPADSEAESIGVSRLLLENLSYLDELFRVIAPLHGASCRVSALSAECGFAADLSGRLPLPLNDFLCLLEGDLKYNGELVMHALENNLIQICNDAVS
jgi:DNA-binding response OmpR family regulator